MKNTQPQSTLTAETVDGQSAGKLLGKQQAWMQLPQQPGLAAGPIELSEGLAPGRGKPAPLPSQRS